MRQSIAEPNGDPQQTLQASVTLMHVCITLRDVPTALELVAPAIRSAERLGNSNLWAEALAIGAVTKFLGGDGIDEEVMNRAIDLFDGRSHDPIRMHPDLILGLLRTWNGEVEEGCDILGRLHLQYSNIGAEHDVLFTAHHLVQALCVQGKIQYARVIADDAQARAAMIGGEIAWAIAYFVQGTVATYCGDVAVARQALNASIAAFARSSARAVLNWVTAMAGLLDVSVGNYARAAQTLEASVAAISGMGFGVCAPPFAPDAAEALIELGRLDEARVLVELLEITGKQQDRAWAIALGGRCRSLLLAAEGQLDEAAITAHASLSAHDRLPMPIERARTLFTLGRVEHRRRRKRAAVQAFEEALELFRSVGAAAWSARVEAELHRTTGQSLGMSELTDVEIRVAEQTATGLTNRAVGARLFISPKTVEKHLSRIYRKLGIRSRAELGTTMARRDEGNA